MTNSSSFVAINSVKDKIQVAWRCAVLYKKEEDGKLSCYIPSFDIYFSASDKPTLGKKAEAMTKLLFDHFFEHTPRNKTLKSLALHLHKLGFKAHNDAYVVKQFLNNHLVSTKFKSVDGNIPSEFSDAESTIQESELEVAV